MLQSVRENNFTSNRDLGGYAQVLGPGFLGHLHGLQAGDHWVDAGAGDCAAVAEYLGTKAHCRVSAIGIHPPANRPACDLHLGRTLEDLPVEEVAPADLITDVYGPLQYSLKLDEVVRWYLRVLKPGAPLLLSTNLVGHMREFYDAYREVLLALGRAFAKELALRW